MRQGELAARVVATNKAHKYAVELQSKLRAAFAPLVGQKILKADGSLLAKYETLAPQCAGNDLHVYRHNSNYSLAWCVKACESVPPHGCVYYEVTAYVGDLEGQVLKSLSPALELRSDYTVKEIEGKIAAYEAAKKAADTARSEVYPFQEFIR